MPISGLRAPRLKPYLTRKTRVRGEALGPFWLLKRDDPYVWFGARDGHVFTGYVLPGGDLPEGDFIQPGKKHFTQSIVKSPFTPTSELALSRHGAAGSLATRGRDFEMVAFFHPGDMSRYVVAGFDPRAKKWVTE